jgi:hypothetical protein
MEAADPVFHTLVPFDSREGLSLKAAAAIAGKSERTLRNWCAEHHIGRRVAGGAYRDGARGSFDPVADYYHRLGLSDLLGRPEFAG